METLLLVSSVLLWLLVILNLLLTLGLARRVRRALSGPEMLRPGEAAPGFRAWTLDGREVSTADYAGRPLALVFISPGCGPCREQVPALQKVLGQPGADGVQVLLVSDGGPEETRRFLEETGSPFPAVVAPRAETRFLEDYRVWATPSYCLVGPDGRVAAAGLHLEELGERVRTVRGRKEVGMERT